MIRAEDVADLREGDVVEVVETCCGDEITTRGPVRREGDYLNLGNSTLVRRDGEPASWYHTITVVSRAPRPLYVNHPRTEPRVGDVVRDADGTEASRQIWVCGEHPPGDRFEYPEAHSWLRWNAGNGRWTYFPQSDLPARLRLLVDGTTGMTVPS